MRILDIITESKQLNEAPMGFLKSVGNKVASKFGSASATGRLETGNIANQIHKEFEKFLGQTGGEADAQTVIDFLKSKGYPTQAAEKVAASVAPAQQATPSTTTSAAKPATTAPKQSAKPAAATPATTAPKQSAKPAAPVNYDEPTWKRKGMQPPKLTPSTATTEPPVNYDEPTWKRKGMQPPATTAAPAKPASPDYTQKQNYNVNYGAIPTGAPMQSKVQVPTQSSAPAQPAPAAPKARGGKVAGQVSQTPNAIRKRNARAAQTQVNSDIDYDEMYEAALPKSIVDKMILAAAQEAAKNSALNPQQSAPAAPAQQAAPQSSGSQTAPAGQTTAVKGQPQAGFMAGLTGSDNTAASNATLAQRLTLKQVQDAALALSKTDQQKLLKFLTTKIGTAAPAATTS